MTLFDQKLAESYQDLSAKLQEAADFVSTKPIDVATRSLRAISQDAGVSPITFTRMARALGYEGYEDLREEKRLYVGRTSGSLSDNLARLQDEHTGDELPFVAGHLSACMANLHAMGLNFRDVDIEAVVDKLHGSRKVLVSGLLGSKGIADYFCYMANFISDKWYHAGRGGTSIGGNLVDMDENDTLIVITKPPYARKSVQAAEFASKQGVFVVVITDTHKCPALAHASVSFMVPTDSSHFFSSYVATTALVEALVGMLAAKKNTSVQDRIAKVEETNLELEYLAE